MRALDGVEGEHRHHRAKKRSPRELRRPERGAFLQAEQHPSCSTFESGIIPYVYFKSHLWFSLTSVQSNRRTRAMYYHRRAIMQVLDLVANVEHWCECAGPDASGSSTKDAMALE